MWSISRCLNGLTYVGDYWFIKWNFRSLALIENRVEPHISEFDGSYTICIKVLSNI